MKYSEIKHVRHPPLNEVIDKILDKMTMDSPYVFEVLWGEAYVVKEIEVKTNQKNLKKCFDKMIKEDLITSTSDINASYGNNFSVKVRLTKRGDKIRESGGWLKHLEKSTAWYLKAFQIIAGVEVLIVIIGGLVQINQAAKQDKADEKIERLQESLTRQQNQILRLDSLLKNQVQKDKNDLPDSTKTE